MQDTSMPWIKLYTDFLDDTKTSQLSDSIKLRFIQLTLIAGECDADGALVIADKAMTHAEISWRLRIDKAQLSAEMEQLKSVGVIAEIDGMWAVVNFAKRQGRSQSEKRSKWREWQQTHRAKKEAASDVGPKVGADVMHDTALTQQGVMDIEKSREENINTGAPALDESENPQMKDPLEDIFNRATSSKAKDETLQKILHAKLGDESIRQTCIDFHACFPDATFVLTHWRSGAQSLRDSYHGNAELLIEAAKLARKSSIIPNNPSGLVWAVDKIKDTRHTQPAQATGEYIEVTDSLGNRAYKLVQHE